MGMEGISDLLSSLSADDMANLKSMASSLMGSMGGGGGDQQEQNNSQPASQPQQKEDNGGGFNFSPDDMAMIMRVKGMMSNMNQKDSRSDLIMALKPHLSEQRQKRADDAMRIMSLMQMLPMLKDIF